MNIFSNRKFMPLAYLTGLLGMCFIVIAIFITRTSATTNQIYGSSKDIIDTSKDWHLANMTEAVDLATLGNQIDVNQGSISIFYQLPKVMNKDLSLFYRTKDIISKVYIDGQLLYETTSKESRFYNRSPGNLWNAVYLQRELAGKTVEIQLHIVYDTSAVTIDHLYLGDKTDIIHYLFQIKGWALVISVIVMLIGLVLMGLNFIPVFHRNTRGNAYLFLGLYSVLMGLYSVIETNVLQIYTQDGRLLQLLDNICMIVDSFPLLIYLNSYFHIFKKLAFRIYGYMQLAYIYVCVIAQFTGIADMHDLLKGSWFFSFCFNLIFLGIFAYASINTYRTKTVNTEKILQFMGFTFMSISSIISMAHFTTQDSMDRAVYLRAGILGFVVCFAISTAMATFRILGQGLRYHIVQDMAMHDALTGLGNRTAYLEHITELASQDHPETGIVIFDVNDLKYGNDTYGHTYGDNMIVSVAKCLNDSFSSIGKCYRIGGDEFCVVLTRPKAMNHINNCLIIFNKGIERESSTFAKPLSVAFGYAVNHTQSREDLAQLISKADKAMYEKKLEMKHNHIQA